MPGYTHLQRAQPVYLSHHLLAYFWMFRRDLERFDHCLDATAELPLGAGALAGVNWNTSRSAVADELGFDVGRARTRSTPSRTATSCSTSCRPPRSARCTSPGSAPRSCSGRARSSGSSSCLTRSARARASCLRRRTPMRPSCCARRRPGWPATWSACSACCTPCRLPTTRTCRRTRSICSTPSTRSTSASQAATGMLRDGDLQARAARRGRGRRVPCRHRRRRPAGAARAFPFREAHGIVGGLVRHALE